jgi:hypothetical protein
MIRFSCSSLLHNSRAKTSRAAAFKKNNQEYLEAFEELDNEDGNVDDDDPAGHGHHP